MVDSRPFFIPDEIFIVSIENDSHQLLILSPEPDVARRQGKAKPLIRWTSRNQGLYPDVFS